MKVKRVWVKWIDHTTYTNTVWRDVSFVVKDLRPVEVETMGFLIKKRKNSWIVAQTISVEDGNTKTMNEFCILRDAIIDWKELT